VNFSTTKRLCTSLACAALILGGCGGNTFHAPEATTIDVAKGRRLSSRALRAHDEGDRNKARDLYREAVQVAPTQWDIWNNLGVLLMEEKNYLDAQLAFRKAIEFDPTNPLPHANIGTTWLDAGYASEAKTHFNSALELDKNNLQALRGAIRADFELNLGDEITLERIERALLSENSPEWRAFLESQRLRVKQMTGS